MAESEMEIVTVFAGTPVDADFVKMILESEGIEAFLKDENMGHLAPFYVAAAGAGPVKVQVLRKDLSRARQIVQDFLRENPPQ